MSSFPLAALGLTLVTLMTGSPSAQTAPADPPAGDCIRSSSEARYRNGGYDHLVFITNACTPDARCKVTTDVNPAPIEVTVPGKSTVDVLTWRGSPASTFTPYVTCKL